MDEAGGQDDGQNLPGKRARAQNYLGDRSASVYGVLVAGVAVLLLLLGIVWYTATDDGGGQGPVCAPVDWADAKQAINNGQVERLRVVLNDEDPAKYGPLIIQLDMINNSCGVLPQGVQYRDMLNMIIGEVYVYNEVGDQRVAIEYPRQDNPENLLVTATPTPGPTEPPTPTATAAPASPTAEPATATPTVEPTWTPTVPVAPASVEAGSPVPTETPGTP